MKVIRKKLPIVLLLASVSSGAFASELKDSGVGLKLGLLYSCLGSAGLTYASPIDQSSAWEMSFLSSNISHKSSALTSQDESGTADLDDEDVVIDTAIQKRCMVHGQWRYFPTGKSFNLGLGLGAARVVADLNASDAQTGDQLEEKYTIDYALWSFTIGQIWRRDWGWVGVDYIGTSGSLGRRASYESTPETPPTDNLQTLSDNFDDSANFCSINGGGMLLIFSLGLFI